MCKAVCSGMEVEMNPSVENLAPVRAPSPGGRLRIEARNTTVTIGFVLFYLL